jgi:16S rRNA (cytosine967-C5)-methyltransferase
MTLLNGLNEQKPREIAAQILQRRAAGVDFVENILEKTLADTRLSSADRGLCQELVYGVVRWQATLDWLIAQKTPGRTQKIGLQNLLRLGLYQIFWLDRIPNHAAVHETVEQAKRNGFGPQAGFVNAILRGYLREFDATKNLLAELKTTQPHIGYSHPGWLVERWQKRWGLEKAAQLMEWNNTPPKTFARINTLKTDAEKLLPQWRDENVEYDFVRRDWLEENLIFELKSHPPLAQLPSFQQGFFYIQDPSTLFAVRELNPQPSKTVLDLCAAPGGKTTYIAQITKNEGKIIAYDTSTDRLNLIEENCARLGVTSVEMVSPDDSKFKIQNLKFDRILVDAPCSNTGVMRRRVDLRWRISANEVERLRSTQLDLLKQAATWLKPGGTLVYSTCSLEPEENNEVMQQFLAEHIHFKLEIQRELLPFLDKVDGAFVAKLRKLTSP